MFKCVLKGRAGERARSKALNKYVLGVVSTFKASSKFQFDRSTTRSTPQLNGFLLFLYLHLYLALEK